MRPPYHWHSSWECMTRNEVLRTPPPEEAAVLVRHNLAADLWLLADVHALHRQRPVKLQRPEQRLHLLRPAHTLEDASTTLLLFWADCP